MHVGSLCAAVLGSALLVCGTNGASPARAEPTAPSTVCASYPDLPDCTGRVPGCALCHDSTDPPAWNSFGSAIQAELPQGSSFRDALPGALAAVADDDADHDGVSNLAELRRGTSPSVADEAVATGPSGLPNPRFHIGDYDSAFAFRRLSTLYCGRSPSYAEARAFVDGQPDADTTAQRLHEALDRCLASDYWRNEGLLRLADKRIKPVRAFGKATDIVIGDVRVVIGDYEYDYNLWGYALTDDRDMREMLTAQYHLVKGADGAFNKVTGLIEKPDPQALAGGQPVPVERRAGLLTTQWFLAYNTMFSPLPRVTGAQAYRAFLGADIANNEGLRPVEGEPVDVDKRGVANPRCANCHSTLDPLSYAFTEYEGISLGLTPTFGVYEPARPKNRIPDWDATRQKSVLLGKPVRDLVEWARVAADSDEFRRTIADMFFHHALARSPEPDERAEFNALWQSAVDDAYSANRLLHRLIDSKAFGSP